MANFFDQFDEQPKRGNFFDQFDSAEPAGETSLAPSVSRRPTARPEPTGLDAALGGGPTTRPSLSARRTAAEEPEGDIFSTGPTTRPSMAYRRSVAPVAEEEIDPTRLQQMRDIEERLADPKITDREREFRERQLSDLQLGAQEIRNREQEAGARRIMDEQRLQQAEISRTRDVGRRIARGATNIGSGALEGLAIADVARAREQVEDGFSGWAKGMENRIGQMRDIQTRLTDPSITPQERLMRERELRDIQAGNLEMARRMGIVQERAAGTPKDRPQWEAARGLRSASLDLFGTPDVAYDEEFIGKLAEGGGSMLGFVLTTVAGSVVAGPAGGVIAGGATGSAVSASEMYNRAINEGATEEQAMEAAFWGSLVGTTEVIPIARALDVLPSSLRSKVKNELGRRLANGLVGAAEEGAQELGSGILKNLIEQKIWDPEQQLITKETTEEAIIGAILGGGLGAAFSPKREPNDTYNPRFNKPSDNDSGVSNELLAEGRKIIEESAGVVPDVPQQPVAPAAEASPTVPAAGPVTTRTQPEQPDQPEFEILPEIDVDASGQEFETGRMVKRDTRTGAVEPVEPPPAEAPAPDTSPEAEPTLVSSQPEQPPATPDLEALEDQVTKADPDEGYGFTVKIPEADTAPTITAEHRADLEAGIIPADISPNTFLYKTADSQTVPIDQIKPIRARPGGIARAKPLMAKAALGGARRVPLSVRKEADGTYTLLDGNSTYAVLKGAGVKSAEVRVMDDATFKAESAMEGARLLYTNPDKMKQRVTLPDIPDRRLRKETVRALSTKQPFNTVSEAVDTEAQAAAQVELNTALRGIAEGMGLPYKDAKAKEGGSAQRKVDTKYGGRATFLTDTVRGTIEVRSIEQADQVVDQLAERYSVIDEGYEATDTGYVDRKVLIRMDDGRLAELQILPPGMMAAKKASGHDLYKISRDETKPEAERARAREQSRQLYSGVLAQVDPSWSALFNQSGTEADRMAEKSSSEISGERSSESSTSRGTDQLSEPTNTVASAAPSSSDATPIPSNSKNRVDIDGVPPSSTDNVNAPDRNVNAGGVDRSKFDAFVTDLRARLKKMMIRGVEIDFDPDMTQQGATEVNGRGDIRILIGQTVNPQNTLNHEAIHVLREIGLFTDKEWAALSSEAERFWMKKFDIAQRYPNYTREMQIEEAVAEAFADFVDNGRKPASTVVQKLFQKMRRFINAVREALGGAKINTVEDIFTAVDSGFVGAREETQTREERAAAARAAEARFRRNQRQQATGQRAAGVRATFQERASDGTQRKAGDGAGRYSGGGLAPLDGAPRVEGASGPDERLVAVAEAYAAERGIDLRRQAEFVEVDPARAKRIADAYEKMEHAPQDPRVKEAFQNLIDQTKAQYEALVAAGYEFTFFDSATDPYGGNPWNAMRDLRANQKMAVYGTYDGFGTVGVTDAMVDDNPMMQETGYEWADQNGEMRPVLANDLFRAVHDAFGHGIEGAGFRARGEENAWQAHSRLFTGSALAAITTETRGQNSWLNYGPYGEQNRNASVEDTVFAEQKTGLMPSWTWTEGRAGDMGEATSPSSTRRNEQRQPVTETPQFKRWFADSKVVDENGDPMVMYHGTTGDIGSFRTPSYFTAASDEASAYTFWKDLSWRERVMADPKVTAVEAPEGLKRLPYVGIFDDIPTGEVGKWYATDNGIARRKPKGRFDVATNYVVDYGNFKGDTIGVKPGDYTEEVAREKAFEQEMIDIRSPEGKGLGGNVVPVYLSIQNPKEMGPFEANRLGARLEQMTPAEVQAYVADLESQGFDGIKTVSDDLAYTVSGGARPVQFIAFRPEQIKGLYNAGNFDRNDPRILYQERAKPFDEWFGDSKAVDDNGDPLIVYHGSPDLSAIEAFDASKIGSRDGGFFGNGFYFATDFDEAEAYSVDDDGEPGDVGEFYVRVENPFVFDISTDEAFEETLQLLRSIGIEPRSFSNRHTFNLVGDQPRKFTVAAKRAGYDGAFVRKSSWQDDSGSDLEEIVVFDPGQIKAVGNRGTFDRNDPRIWYQSQALRAGGIEDLTEYGISPGGKYKVREIAAALEARTRDRFGKIGMTDTSDEAADKLSSWMADEVLYEFDNASDEKSAVGWYSDKMQRALDQMGALFPEMAGGSTDGTVFDTSQQARDYFTALLAITSDGERVYNNLKRAVKLYRDARKTGVLPTDIKAMRATNLNVNLRIINRLHEEHGAGMRAHLLDEFPASEINAQIREHNERTGEKLSQAKFPADRMLPRSAIYFGPKLGAFYANLSGADGYLTMDLWFMRTVNRMRGQLISAPTKDSLEKFETMVLAQRQGLELPAPKLKASSKEYLNRMAELKEQVKGSISRDQLLSIAAEYRDAYKKKGYKNGTVIERTANTIAKAAFDQINEAPMRTSERGFLMDVVAQAQQKLEDVGVKMSIADMQAVLWYYEKRLYGDLGARQSDDVSYEETVRRVIREEGEVQRGRGNDAGDDVRAADVDRGELALAVLADAANQRASGAVAKSRRLYQQGSGQAAADAEQGPVSDNRFTRVTQDELTALSRGDLDPGEFFSRPGWGALSAQQDWGDNPLGAQNNARLHEQLREELDRRGLPYVEQRGMYKGGEELSFMVLADQPVLEQIGKLFSQESILTNEGLVYLRRKQPATPLTGEFLTGKEAMQQDFFSSMAGGLRYSLDLDFTRGAGVPVFPEGYTPAADRPQLPVNEKGKVELHHWGPAGLTVVDPSFAGTGPVRGAERSAGQKQSFFGINPRESQMEPGTGYVKEGGLPDNHYVAEVDPQKLYPWFEDPMGYGEALTGDTMSARRIEKTERIKDGGYLGYYVTDDGSMRAPLGNVATLFEAVPVTTWKRRAEQRPIYLKNPVPMSPFIPNRGVWDELTGNSGLWARWSGAKGALMDRFDRARFYLQDRMLPLLRAQEAIEKAMGGTLPEHLNVYMKEIAFSGRVASRFRQIDEDFMKPALQIIMDTDGMTVAKFGDYLYAKHALERNERLEAIDAQSQDDLSGMTNDEAQAVIDAAENGPNGAQYLAAADLVYQMNRATLQRRVDAGLLSQADADAWSALYQFYVPLRGWAETDSYEDNLSRSGVSSKFSVTGQESKRALGRKSKAYNPFVMSHVQSQEVVIRAEKNRIAQTLGDLVEQFPSPNLWEIKPVETRRYYNRSTGLVEERAVSPLQTGLAENEMAFKRGGKEVRILFFDKRLAASVGTVNAQHMGAIVQLASKFSRYFSAVTTMLNPAFTVVNAFRDLLTAQVNIAAMGEADAAAIRKAMVRDYRRSMVTAWRGQKVGAYKSTDQELKWWKEYEQSGARVAFWVLPPAEEAGSNIQLEERLGTGSVARRAVEFARSPSAWVSTDLNPALNWIERANLAVDNTIRFAAYKEARRLGWSKDRAAQLAKDLTVNFNRRGTFSPFMNAMYPFFNAAVQGTQVLFKVLGNKKVQAVVGAMVLQGLVEDLINAALSDEDDDGELAYDKLENYKLEMNAVIFAGGDVGVTVPLPYGYNVFPYLGKQMGKTLRGVKSPGEAMGDFLSAAFGAFSPIMVDSNDDTGMRVIKAVTPTMLDPWVEVGLNEDWMGRQIVPRNAYGDYGPDAYKYYDGASDAALAVADILNRATGGNQAQSGLIDISPEEIDHIWAFHVGGLGRFTGDVVDTASAIIRNDPDDIETFNIPFGNKLVSEVGDFQDLNRYYTFRERVKNAVAAVDAQNDTGDRASEENQRLARLEKAMKLADKQLRVVRKEQAAVGRDATATQRKSWQERRGKIATVFNRKYLEAMGPQAE